MSTSERCTAGYDRFGHVELTDTLTGQTLYLQGQDAQQVTSETTQAALAEYFTSYTEMARTLVHPKVKLNLKKAHKHIVAAFLLIHECKDYSGTNERVYPGITGICSEAINHCGEIVNQAWLMARVKA